MAPEEAAGGPPEGGKDAAAQGGPEGPGRAGRRSRPWVMRALGWYAGQSHDRPWAVLCGAVCALLALTAVSLASGGMRLK